MQITRDGAENVNTDWFDENFGTGTFVDYNLSSAKGFEGGSFYVSGNYRKDKGVLNHNELQRMSIRSNLTFDPTKDLTIGFKLNLSYTDNERREDDLTTITKFSLPWMPVRRSDNPLLYFNPYTGANLVAQNDPNNRLNNVKQYRALGNLSLKYNIPFIEGLSLRSELSTDIIQSNLIHWRGRDISLDGEKEPFASADEEAVTVTSLNYNFYGNFDRTIGQHFLSFVSGAEMTRQSQYFRNLGGLGLTGTYQQIGVPGDASTINSRLDEERYLLGYFGRFNYKFNDRYLFGISGRRDGSSSFTAENRWGTFLAFSGGWILSEESFMDFLGKNTFLKIRASYGETGNQSIRPGLDRVGYYEKAVYGDRSVASNGVLPSNVANKNLLWETTQSVDVGLDFGFLNDRINGSIGYYKRFIKNMLLEVQLPSSAGISPVTKGTDFRFLSSVDGTEVNKFWSNIGNMENSGVEFEIYTINIAKPNFKWSTSFNISFNQNIVKSLTPELNRTGLGITSPYTITQVGHRRSVWYLADWAGVGTEDGLPYIYALDQETFSQTGKSNRLQTEAGVDSLIIATRTNIRENQFVQGKKSSDPTYYGGISNKFEYKGFDLSALFTFSGGNYIMDYDRQVAVYANGTRQVLAEALTQIHGKNLVM